MKIPNSNIEVKWLGHAGLLIKNSQNIYIDPYNLSSNVESEKADIIFLTHSHYDHCSIVDMQKIVKPGTRIICPADCQSKITRFSEDIKITVINPRDSLKIGQIDISILPAHNNDKPFHDKEEGWVGYLIKFENVLIYHAGDTDLIPEMQKLTGYKQKNNQFIAFLPVGGRFTMTAEEAAKAAKLIKPSIAIPIHYGTIIGSKEDAYEFQELCQLEGIKAEILEKS